MLLLFLWLRGIFSHYVKNSCTQAIFHKKELCGMRNQHSTQDVRHVMWSLAGEHDGLPLIEFLSSWNEAGLNWINLVLFQLSEQRQSPQKAEVQTKSLCFYIYRACGATWWLEFAHWQSLPICVVCCMHMKTKSRLQTPVGGQFSSIRNWPTFPVAKWACQTSDSQQSWLLHNCCVAVIKCKQHERPLNYRGTNYPSVQIHTVLLIISFKLIIFTFLPF